MNLASRSDTYFFRVRSSLPAARPAADLSQPCAPPVGLSPATRSPGVGSQSAARNTLDSARIPRASKLLICGLFQKGRVLAQDGVHWYNTQRLLEPIGNVAPVEYEMNCYRSQEELARDGETQLKQSPENPVRFTDETPASESISTHRQQTARTNLRSSQSLP